jgi:hypothetical protein
MTIQSYSAARYKWAVVCSVTFVYYFPKRRGRIAAERMARRMNAAESGQ